MILVLDTSSSQLSIGLAFADGTLLAEFHVKPDSSVGQRAIHDARLAIETEKLLRSHSMSAGEVTRIGIIIGPGSFTGLRIGLSFAKGLAFATGAEIVPMTLHEVLQTEAGGFDGLIVTPAYRQELCYVSEASSPNAIKFLTQDEFSKQLPRQILAHDSFLLQDLSFIPRTSSFVSLSLEAMARLTVKSEEVTIGPALDALEPLYLTEFSVGVPAKPKN
jgi:tRNA threonylcarbamoyl adenosine modification protein YeaZ